MRQNPHVRICGGPGSATTLVYPTLRRRRPPRVTGRRAGRPSSVCLPVRTPGGAGARPASRPGHCRRHGIVKLSLTAVSDAQHGGFATGWGPVSSSCSDLRHADDGRQTLRGGSGRVFRRYPRPARWRCSSRPASSWLATVESSARGSWVTPTKRPPGSRTVY